MSAQEQIYLGRIVAVAVTREGRPVALYRVSSRSFPNRMARIADNRRSVAIVPKPGHEADIGRNPYIAYNCARLVGDYAVLANGSHADPTAEKIAMGIPPRDALALALLAMDYEKDEYSTPRITAIANARDNTGWLGVVRKGGLDVQSFALEPGNAIHISTYGHDIPERARVSPFPVATAEEATTHLFAGGVFAGFSHPVTAVAAVADGKGGFDLAVREAGE